MDSQVILTFIRQVLISLGTVFVTKGVLDAAMLETIVGGAVALVAVVWGLIAKKKDQAIIKAVSE